ncbi:ribose-phosphate pyrophosphokinase [candidate division KSB1 bacterium]|nr:ribose-phosphate pyrophosphokinase [candidate division KSB1 bacterium]RQV99911.1 MAG: ribose-phosphate pyrophosphokinase [candidate division KSB1 bacterium]
MSVPRNGEAKVFSGRSNPWLAEKIAQYLGQPLGKVTTKNFSDGEIWVKYEENIRGTDVFIIQSTHAPADNVMELLIMLDAARRASAHRITAVIPYFGYARQDRKDQPRVSITAKMIANLIVEAGADRVLTLDLHAPQIQGFFDIPFDHLYGAAIFINHIVKMNLSDLVVVSPDIGGVHLARAYASRLKTELALLNKKRVEHNVCTVTEFIGDVKDKNVLVVDDLVDTAGTLTKGVHVLKDKGARDIYVAATHPVLSNNAIQKIEESAITKIFFTDSIHLPEESITPKMHILSLASLFADSITRIHNEKSISDLFPQKSGPMH